MPEEQVDAEKTKQLIVAAGQECLLIPQDIRDEQGCNRVIEQVVQAWGRIDILVNNASVMVRLLSDVLRDLLISSTTRLASPTSPPSSLTGP